MGNQLNHNITSAQTPIEAVQLKPTESLSTRLLQLAVVSVAHVFLILLFRYGLGYLLIGSNEESFNGISGFALGIVVGGFIITASYIGAPVVIAFVLKKLNFRHPFLIATAAGLLSFAEIQSIGGTEFSIWLTWLVVLGGTMFAYLLAYGVFGFDLSRKLFRVGLILIPVLALTMLSSFVTKERVRVVEQTKQEKAASIQRRFSFTPYELTYVPPNFRSPVTKLKNTTPDNSNLYVQSKLWSDASTITMVVAQDQSVYKQANNSPSECDIARIFRAIEISGLDSFTNYTYPTYSKSLKPACPPPITTPKGRTIYRSAIVKPQDSLFTATTIDGMIIIFDLGGNSDKFMPELIKMVDSLEPVSKETIQVE